MFNSSHQYITTQVYTMTQAGRGFIRHTTRPVTDAVTLNKVKHTRQPKSN